MKEKYRLSQKMPAISFFTIFIFLFFPLIQPYANTEEGTRTERYELKFQPEESFEIRNGRRVYQEHCSPCHGKYGKGDGNYYASDLKPKPGNFTDPDFMDQVQDEYLIEVIKKGTAAFGKSPFCPPWQYTLKEEEKIRNVVTFLRTFTVKTAR
ncbi:cytochrome c, mono- and diheme variant [Candidatus Scalindua japonica]|uniref:Cytochrome c, mono-and diheme variant n=1 Tax=Candidatus Scalindua japonica TaxID=1284222 RepID=A0A286U2S0_9BACT|nr:cytochrome c [Candidatus Scalindua japonica]GAX62440.1 cytochrome c, mono- and diheme variants [Candidatus Scalindua japonica]GAX62446.1 cytochrome c, mono- and diheme variant [Candidatus Scalindua japonica]